MSRCIIRGLLSLVLAAGCGGKQDVDVDEPGPSTEVVDVSTEVASEPMAPSPPVVEPAPAPKIVTAAQGTDPSCVEDDDCIAVHDASGCGCCNCADLFITSKSSYEWLMAEVAKEQCDVSWCVTVDCMPCPPPTELGEAVCHEGVCSMIVPPK